MEHKYRVKYKKEGRFTDFNGIWYPKEEKWYPQYKFTGVLGILFPFWFNIVKGSYYTNRDSAEYRCIQHSKGEMKKELKNGDVFPVNI